MTPTLAVTETCRPPTWNGSWKEAPILRATASSLERAFDVFEQDGELVAAESREHVAFADAAREPLHDFTQQHVAGLVAERLVHHFEPVEIQHQAAPSSCRGATRASSLGRVGRRGTADSVCRVSES